MMADFDKDSMQCLVCNTKVVLSARNSIHIFDESYTISKKPLVDVISAILGIDIDHDSVHSPIICKKCFKQFSEVKTIMAFVL